MSVGSVVSSAILLILGAAIGLIPTFLLERSKRRHALETRWDVPLFELSGKFLSAARSVVHAAKRLDRSADRDTLARTLDDRHAELRGLYEQLRLLGSSEVQTAARKTIHHCYAVRAVAEGAKDERLKDYPGTTPEGRVKVSLRDLVIAVRAQLGVALPEDVPNDQVLPDEPWPSPRLVSTEPPAE